MSAPNYLVPQAFSIRAIPGYSGYIPAKQPENVMGQVVARANNQATYIVEQRTRPEEYRGNIRSHGLVQRKGTNVPGYSGFVPGRFADNVFGHSQARCASISLVLKKQQLKQKNSHAAVWQAPHHPRAPGLSGPFAPFPAATIDHES